MREAPGKGGLAATPVREERAEAVREEAGAGAESVEVAGAVVAARADRDEAERRRAGRVARAEAIRRVKVG